MIEKLNSDFIYKNLDNRYSHTQYPVVFRFKKKVRVFFSKRDKKNRSRPFFIDLDPKNLKKIVYEKKKPLLNVGNPGMFDDAGVMPTSVIKHKNLYYMYYIGWNVRKNIPYSNHIGLAISKDCENFKKYSNIPIFNSTTQEPYYSASLQVIKKKKLFYGAYLSCIGWKKIKNVYEPFYDVKMATSKNGLDWSRNGKTILKLKKREGGICPSDFIKIDNKYFIIYCYRGYNNFRSSKKNSYKIGLAFTKNLKNWKRIDKKIQLKVTKNSWNSDMQCYPSLLKTSKGISLFYNGNGFGKSGIGLVNINKESNFFKNIQKS